MFGPFIHQIDPIIFSLGGVHIWWYGLSFTLGFLNVLLFIRRNREQLFLSVEKVYDLALFLTIGVLIGGRAVIVINNEWSFYREFPELIPAVWVGGMASHGLIFGGAIGALLFCRFYRVPFRPLLDVLAISAAIILAFGRIGNFIDGQIYGSLTDMPWGVKFPNVEGFRHPVVLYDGLKNILLVPLLLWIKSRNVPPGRVAAIFVILYAGLRIPIDLLREYPITTLGLPTGQTLNIVMLVLGVAALGFSLWKNRSAAPHPRVESTASQPQAAKLWPRRAIFAAVSLIPLIIPSDATRDIPFTYGSRHPGLQYSSMYPPIQDDLMRTAETPRGR
jgi:phosphatidylglycerol:prolipoprotein diacylglycerol transferase